MILTKVKNGLSKVIDFKMGFIGALFMGGIVFYINSDHGPFLATTAALKQAFYTFFVGGLILKILEVIVRGIRNKALAYFCAVVVATLITVGLVYFVHSLKGTPKPFESTIPTIILAPVGFSYAARLKRNNKSVPGFKIRKERGVKNQM